MKQSKRILFMLLVVVLIVSMASFSVSAANTSDTTHTISIGSAFTRDRAYRPKEDTSKIYLRIDSCVFIHNYVQAQGCNSTGGNRTSCTLVEGEIVAQVVCRTGVQYSIKNLVNEYGYACASLDFRRLDGGTTQTSLTYTWSPDSTGSYIIAT